MEDKEYRWNTSRADRLRISRAVKAQIPSTWVFNDGLLEYDVPAGSIETLNNVWLLAFYYENKETIGAALTLRAKEGVFKIEDYIRPSSRCTFDTPAAAIAHWEMTRGIV